MCLINLALFRLVLVSVYLDPLEKIHQKKYAWSTCVTRDVPSLFVFMYRNTAKYALAEFCSFAMFFFFLVFQLTSTRFVFSEYFLVFRPSVDYDIVAFPIYKYSLLLLHPASACKTHPQFSYCIPNIQQHWRSKC